MNSTQTVAAVKAILPIVGTAKPELVSRDINDVLARATNPTLPCLDRLVEAATKAGLTIVDNRNKRNYWAA